MAKKQAAVAVEGAMVSFEVVFTGASALLMHNARMADPEDDFAMALKELTSKRKKTNEDRQAMKRIEFMGGLYYDDEIGPYIDASMIRKSIIVGARRLKMGTDYEQCLSLQDMKHRLEYDGPRTPEKLFQDAHFVDQRPVSGNGKPGGPKIKRTRPCFSLPWSFTATLFLHTLIVDADSLAQVLPYAGLAGIGDGRSIGFGKYVAKILRKEKANE